MKGVGGILVLLGAFSIFYNLTSDADVRWLVWINNWGKGPAWGIRIGVIVLGVILWLMGGKGKPQAQAAQQ